MKIRIRKSNFFVPKGYRAITLYPFIFVGNHSDKYNKTLINHEMIHIRQQRELLVLPFYLWYIFDYVRKLFIYGSRRKAYRNILFEREAYINESEPSYLMTRKRFAFWKFRKRKFEI